MNTNTNEKDQENLQVEPKSDGAQDRPALRSLFQRRDFKLLWLGEAVSLIGDQFYLIALPWLVLQLTGNALAMGSVLALAGIPRALFMLVGGALTDRFTPRTIMLASNLGRMLLVGLLALWVWNGRIELWMLYIMALTFGLIDAFFYPAQSAIVPRIVGKEQLPMANSVIQGTAQLSLFAGPVLAGLLISFLDNPVVTGLPAGAGELRGISLAFALDAVTFLASAITLWKISPGVQASQNDSERNESLLKSIRKLLVVVWEDVSLRTFFLLIAISNFLINGPLFVGIPVLANSRFPEGAAAFGILMSAYGGGSLLGILLAGILPAPPTNRLGIVLGLVWSGLGLGVAALGVISSTYLAATVTLLMGAANGYVVILFISWLQKRTPAAMLGRMMSLLMFASVGLQPLSNMLTGAFLNLAASALFLVSGSLMAGLVLLMLFFNPSIRSMETDNVQLAAAAD